MIKILTPLYVDVSLTSLPIANLPRALTVGIPDSVTGCVSVQCVLGMDSVCVGW